MNGENMTSYVKWEKAVTQSVAGALEIPYADAAGIVEAQDFCVQQCWGMALPAPQAAAKIISAGQAE